MKISGSALVLLAALGCGGGNGYGGGPTAPNPNPSGPSASASVNMRSQNDVYGELAHDFVPATVTINRGGSVTWTNSTGQIHNVTFAGGAGAPGNIGDHANGTNSRTFSTAGTFNYSCTQHAGMNGQVTVQ